MTSSENTGNPLDDFVAALLSSDRNRVAEITRGVSGSFPILSLETLIVGALEEIGRRWECGSASLSQLYLSSRLCEELTDSASEKPVPSGTAARRMAIAVLDDYHMLGKRLVASALRASGFPVIDFGRMAAGPLVARVVSEKVEVLLISVLMLPSALRIRELIARLRDEGQPPIVVVGGAPFRFDRELGQEVGADFSGATASDAVRIVTNLKRGLG